MSSLLFDVIFASRCRSTHHKLALDALRFVRGEASVRWTQLFLSLHEPYLEGSKAPDELFKDFRNHVLHVGENFWGGAVTAAEKWYDKTVAALRRKSWEEAIYAAGVLSHYFTDPFMPLHTGQSETENVVHRAVEWSIAQSYGELQQILEHDLGGYPDFEAPDGKDWLGEMIRQGARRAHAHYQTVLDHYDVTRGTRDPHAGMDQELKDAVATLLGRAAVGFGRVLEIAFEEAEVTPPEVDITIQGFLATLNVPVYWLVRQLANSREQWQVAAMLEEFQRTGKVLQTLTEDQQSVRRLHAQEVLQTPLARLDAEPAGETGGKFGTGTAHRAHSNRPITGNPKLREAKADPLPPLPKFQPAPRPQPSMLEASLGPPPQVAAPRQPVAKTPEPPPPPRVEKLAKQPVVQQPTATPAPPPTRPAIAGDPRPAATQPVQTPTKAPERPALNTQELTMVRSAVPTVRYSTPTTKDARFYLELSSPVADAPSIGPKTAERLSVLKVETVQDLLELQPESAAAKLQSRFITADVLRDWQAQAELVLSIPELRGHDAQILVACGIREPGHLTGLDSQALFSRVDAFCNSAAGERVLRNGSRPTRDEVTGWITRSQSARAA